MKNIFENTISSCMDIFFDELRQVIRRAWLAKLSFWPLSNKCEYRGGRTDIDKFMHELISDFLLSKNKTLNIYSEEGIVSNGGPISLLLDPLDGTHNLYMGYPFFSTCIAVFFEEKYIMAWVYDISRDIIFKASINEGAYMQNIYTSKRIKTSEKSLLYLSIMRAKIDNHMCIQQLIISHADKIRISSCSSLDLCFIASGALTAFVDFHEPGHEKFVDISAPALILREAGGDVFDHNHAPLFIPAPTEASYNKEFKITAVSSDKIINLLSNLIESIS